MVGVSTWMDRCDHPSANQNVASYGNCKLFLCIHTPPPDLSPSERFGSRKMSMGAEVKAERPPIRFHGAAPVITYVRREIDLLQPGAGMKRLPSLVKLCARPQHISDQEFVRTINRCSNDCPNHDRKDDRRWRGTCNGQQASFSNQKERKAPLGLAPRYCDVDDAHNQFALDLPDCAVVSVIYQFLVPAFKSGRFAHKLGRPNRNEGHDFSEEAGAPNDATMKAVSAVTSLSVQPKPSFGFSIFNRWREPSSSSSVAPSSSHPSEQLPASSNSSTLGAQLGGIPGLRRIGRAARVAMSSIDRRSSRSSFTPSTAPTSHASSSNVSSEDGPRDPDALSNYFYELALSMGGGATEGEVWVPPAGAAETVYAVTGPVFAAVATVAEEGTLSKTEPLAASAPLQAPLSAADTANSLPTIAGGGGAGGVEAGFDDGMHSDALDWLLRPGQDAPGEEDPFAFTFESSLGRASPAGVHSRPSLGVDDRGCHQRSGSFIGSVVDEAAGSPEPPSRSEAPKVPQGLAALGYGLTISVLADKELPVTGSMGPIMGPYRNPHDTSTKCRRRRRRHKRSRGELSDDDDTDSVDSARSSRARSDSSGEEEEEEE